MKEINEALNNILTRSSVRLYQERVVIPDEDLENIFRAAMAAPTGVNKQPWAFVLVDDRKILHELASELPYAKMADKASAAIVVCGDSSRFLDGVDDSLWIQDLSAVSENILLAAHALGYGSVWTCIYPHEERIAPVTKTLGLPDGIIPFSLIALGRPAHQPHIIDKWQPDRIHRNKWD